MKKNSNKEKLKEAILSEKIIFIIRNNSPETIMELSKFIWEAGGKILEITLNSNQALQTINKLAAKIPKDCFLGAGTAKTAKDVQDAYNNGATFVVTPIFSKELIDEIRKYKLTGIAGAYTPTEIYNAYSLGADYVKVFPANEPKYIRYVKGPLDEIPLIAVGGVSIENAKDFINSGSVAVCVGGSFFNFDKNNKFDKLKLKENISSIKKKLNSD